MPKKTFFSPDLKATQKAINEILLGWTLWTRTPCHQNWGVVIINTFVEKFFQANFLADDLLYTHCLSVFICKTCNDNKVNSQTNKVLLSSPDDFSEKAIRNILISQTNNKSNCKKCWSYTYSEFPNSLASVSFPFSWVSREPPLRY